MSGRPRGADPLQKMHNAPYLSAACKAQKHDRCWSVSCTCDCGHGVYAGMPKKIVKELKRIADGKGIK